MHRAVVPLLLVVGLALVACGGEKAIAKDQEKTVRLGEALHQQLCQSCHGGAIGGTFDQIPPTHNTNGHTWHHPDEEIVQIVLYGLPPRPDGNLMPAFKGQLSQQQAAAILAFIKTWWTEEQRAYQAGVSRQWLERK